MFNLYQNSIITKELIEAKKLQLCRLAFWLCYFNDNHYVQISDCAFSNVIEESKFEAFLHFEYVKSSFHLENSNARSNVLQPIATNEQFNAHSLACIDDNDEDDVNDDD